MTCHYRVIRSLNELIGYCAGNHTLPLHGPQEEIAYAALFGHDSIMP